MEVFKVVAARNLTINGHEQKCLVPHNLHFHMVPHVGLSFHLENREKLRDISTVDGSSTSRRQLLTGTKSVVLFVLKVLPLPLTAKIKSWLSQDTSDVPSAERNREQSTEHRAQRTGV